MFCWLNTNGIYTTMTDKNYIQSCDQLEELWSWCCTKLKKGLDHTHCLVYYLHASIAYISHISHDMGEELFKVRLRYNRDTQMYYFDVRMAWHPQSTQPEVFSTMDMERVKDFLEHGWNEREEWWIHLIDSPWVEGQPNPSPF